MPSLIVSEVMDGSAALLNDVEKTVYSYAAQAPYFKIAYDDLKLELEDNNIPITNRSSVEFNLTTGIDNIGGATGPPLPNDLIEIIALWEKSGTEYGFVNRRTFIAKSSVNQSTVGEWAWKNNTIVFNGINKPTTMMLDYIGEIQLQLVPVVTTGFLPLPTPVPPYPIPPGSPPTVLKDFYIPVFNSSNFLKYRNAALCAEFIGENKERADSLNGNALRAMESLLNIAIKGSQSIATRRRRFRG